MSYAEWCPVCSEPIISVTRGVPSMGSCVNGHSTDRRDVLRRKPVAPEPRIEGWNAAIEAAHAAVGGMPIPIGATKYAWQAQDAIRSIPCPYQPKETPNDQ